MNPRIVVLCMLVLLLQITVRASARDVQLKPGEIYRGSDLTVTCQGAGSSAPTVLSLRDCQYWDKFDKKCLFKKTVFSYFGLECTEECQHWDAFHKICDYQSHCIFYPSQKVFVRRTCDDFDKYSHKCLKIKEEEISPAVRGHR